MDEEPGVAYFGIRYEGVVYLNRPGAYGILFDQAGLLAVVKTPRGYHLPGGGCEPGEQPKQTLLREALEECGLVPGGLIWIGEAWEYLHAEQEQQYYCKQGVFFRGEVRGQAGGGWESNHELIWMAPDEALACLVHGSQRWALAQVLGST